MKTPAPTRLRLLAFLASVSVLGLAPSRATAVQLMVEPFTYPNGNLVGNGGWVAHSAAAVNPIQVGGGEVVLRQGLGSSEDANRPFGVQSATATTYACFKLRVPSLTALTSADYFAHFKDAGLGTIFRSRVFIAPSPGGYTVGLSTGATTPSVLWPSALLLGESYRIVHNYDAATGACTLWVDPVDATSPNIVATSAFTGSAISTYAWRQGGSTTAHNLSEIVDNLGVGSSFEDACVRSDLGIQTFCVTDSLKQCTGTVFTGKPWHAMFTVVNLGQKPADDWSFDIVLRNPGTGEVRIIKQQIAGPPLPAGQGITINWPGTAFTATDKGQWVAFVSVRIKKPANPDVDPIDNQASVPFVVQNPALVSDIGIEAVCVTRDDSLKQCTDSLFAQQPWHVLFKVLNKGEKPLDNWSFDIVLSSPTLPSIVLKQQVAGPPLAVGESRSINWPSPYIFDPTQAGQWTVTVVAVVKDSANPEPPPLQHNNRGSATFVVGIKALVSDIGVHGLCVTLDDSLKQCSSFVFTEQRWHVLFRVFNKGEKPVDNWSFDIFLTNGTPPDIQLKQQIPGPPLAVGQNVAINWPSPYIFDPTQKGDWRVGVVVKVKDPTNPEPPDRQGNNQASATFRVRNKPGKKVCDPDIMVNGDFEIKGTTTLPTDIPGWVGRGWSLGTPAQSGEWAAVDNPSDGVGPPDFLAQRFDEKLVIKCLGYHAWSLDPGTVFRTFVRYWNGTFTASDFVHPGDGLYYPVNPAYDSTNALRVIEFQIASGGPSNAIDHVTLTANLGPVAVDASGIHEAQLRSNIPNPFGLTTAIEFELPRAGRADLEVFDLNGRLVKRLVGTHLDAGKHNTSWDGTDQTGSRAAAGVYIYRLRTGAYSAARRMVLIN